MSELISKYIKDIDRFISLFGIYESVYYYKYYIDSYNHNYIYSDNNIIEFLKINKNKYIELANKQDAYILYLDNDFCIFFKNKKDIESFIKDLYKELINNGTYKRIFKI